MTREMTDERLAELREFRDIVREEQAAGLHAYDRDYEFADAVDEIDRLRAENERLLGESLELKMRPVFDEYREYRA